MIPPRLSPKAMRLRHELLAKLAPLRKKPTPARDWAEFVRQRNSKAGKARWANVPRVNGKRDHLTPEQRNLVSRIAGMGRMGSMTQAERVKFSKMGIDKRKQNTLKRNANRNRNT